MAKYHAGLPLSSDQIYLTDGGLETTLIFHDGIDLPYFASCEMLKTEQGREILRAYFEQYVAIARKYHTGLILESPTWRANADWGDKLGYTAQSLAQVNRDAIEFMTSLREDNEPLETPLIVSGCIGPRDDGYNPKNFMTVDQAEAYHATQINIFADTEADLVSALTITYPEEAIGIARAAKDANIPVAISFTVETDGRLLVGLTMGEAIDQVEQATDGTPTYYMINCAHPTHFDSALESNAPWLTRLRGIRANASTKSHAELDAMDVLDDGDPVDLGNRLKALKERLPHLNIIGGCCGTDHRHIAEIGKACAHHPITDEL